MCLNVEASLKAEFCMVCCFSCFCLLLSRCRCCTRELVESLLISKTVIYIGFTHNNDVCVITVYCVYVCVCLYVCMCVIHTFIHIFDIHICLHTHFFKEVCENFYTQVSIQHIILHSP